MNKYEIDTSLQCKTYYESCGFEILYNVGIYI